MPVHIESEVSDHIDILVVGFGPAGAVAAGMLGQKGHQTLVVDRLTEIYDKPRAIAIDHEILRHFDNMGVADQVLPYVAPFTASQHFGAKGQLIRRIDMVAKPYPLGYTPSMVFTQPPVEVALRRHAESFDCVTVELGTELIDIADTGEEVLAKLKDADGRVRTVSARYVIGCDGAWSTVRQLSGMKLEDLVFDEPWLVVDVQVLDGALSKLPSTSAQFCNPARPTSFIMGPNNHRRWEIMLLPGEDPREMEKPENVWMLLAPWLSPEDGELWRAAAYRFHALVADEWRRGRIAIAGDAAHQQPPFIGQGMCQGLRDVSNLVWKLDRVLRQESSPDLLDTYTVERRRHVRTLTGKIKAIGQNICERDPAAAEARDARILAEGGGQPLTITRQDIVPPIEEGLIAEPSATTLLDKVTGTGWRVLLDGRKIASGEWAGLCAQLAGFAVHAVVPAGKGNGEASVLQEKDGVLADWFDRIGAVAAIVRPDHYVFGAARSLADLNEQLSDLHRRLA
jgi:3-(3-hydroxy-phenyl)propionate hydroxylase